ncbi:MAG: nitrilase family protein [Bacteroidales bacterium]|nr:nitrilase family protein [Candidatus Cacconaster merdequi]
MERNLRIALCQADTVWEDAAATISALEPAVRKFCKKENPDILVFPETFSVGFTMNPSVSESVGGESFAWLHRMAVELGTATVGSVPTNEEGKRYNRCFFIRPDGSFFKYDKRHLFNPSGEGAVYTPGEEQCTVEYLGWRIELNVCYDLRFPVWSRNVGNRYDLLLNIANWPSVRIASADILLRARAVENVCYTAFCNRVGEDSTCSYNGHSVILDFFGNGISHRRTVNGTQFFCAELDISALRQFREKFPAWKDADKFDIER